jgi:hypothetical protein
MKITTYGELLDRFGLDFDFGLTSRFKASPYDKIYELGKTAVERFGNDPKTFRETLKKFEPKKFRKIIKEVAKQSPSCSLRFKSWCIREYLNCLTAILQVDFECPGFIKNFPEALNYLRSVNGCNTNLIVFDFEELYNKTITPFNRYSGKSDFKYVKKLFEIPDEDKNRRYDERDPRFDDYISVWFLKFWKSENEEQRDYLKKHYIYQETLLPEDYQNLISYSGILKKGEVDLEKGDLRWVDLYFERIDEIIESVHKDIDSITPLTMKKINLTLT